MNELPFNRLAARISELQAHKHSGQVAAVSAGVVAVSGLTRVGAIGDRVAINRAGHPPLLAEILRLEADHVTVLPEGDLDGVTLGTPVAYLGHAEVFPSFAWIGQVIDAFGQPLDGTPLAKGDQAYPLRPPAPNAMARRGLGARLDTGVAALDTFLPLVRGQRLGLFAGSGVGKSTLLAGLARSVNADLTVIALIGERGREVREFVENVLGPEGMKRAIVVAATSDQHALVKRRAAWMAMTIAEYFRDIGAQVVFLADSVTRFADAHREIALQSGEPAVLRGYPPSTSKLVMDLCERAGPGQDGQGDISAIFSVLVAGSDMDEPIADLMRGVLDGHIVLSREIAERGRFPAIDVLKSVSRSLPGAASDEENALLQDARGRLMRYEDAKLMVQAGLYTSGNDPDLDKALQSFPGLDKFLRGVGVGAANESFGALSVALGRRPVKSPAMGLTNLPAGT